MKKFYLFCSAGMSTSMLASMMQEVADKHNLPLVIKAFSDRKISEIIEEDPMDVILLGPQVEYRFEEFKKKYGHTGIPIAVINSKDYGMMDGERVLKFAIKLFKDNKKGENQ